jgi:hypothetical protein
VASLYQHTVRNAELTQNALPPAATIQTSTSENPKPPQIVSSSTRPKSFESAATRNGDGTFGPKHTLRPPLIYTLLHESTSAPTRVDVKT